MRIFKVIALVALASAVAGVAYIRLAPSGPEWHMDPETEGITGPGRWLIADGGDAPALRLPAPPDAALDAFDAVARDAGAERLAWEPEAGRATYVDRSAVMGFPDYVSVKVVPQEEGSLLSAYSRLRFGRDDFGVNRERLEAWTGAVASRLGAG